MPVRVRTIVVLPFGPSTASPVSIVDTTQQSAVSIVLKSGSTIHADTVSEEGKNVSYTIGEDSYEIPGELVEKIVKRSLPAPKKKSNLSEGARSSNPPGFESLAEIRNECAADPAGFKTSHPEFANFHGDTCAAFNIDINAGYDAKVDDGVRMEKMLSAKYEGPAQFLLRPSDPNLRDAWHAYQNRRAEIQQVINTYNKKLSDALFSAYGSYDDMNKERQELSERLAKDNFMQDVERERIYARIDALTKMMRPFLEPTEPQPPAVHGAQMQLDRIELDLSRLTVVCQGSPNPAK